MGSCVNKIENQLNRLVRIQPATFKTKQTAQNNSKRRGTRKILQNRKKCAKTIAGSSECSWTTGQRATVAATTSAITTASVMEKRKPGGDLDMKHFFVEQAVVVKANLELTEQATKIPHAKIATTQRQYARIAVARYHVIRGRKSAHHLKLGQHG